MIYRELKKEDLEYLSGTKKDFIDAFNIDMLSSSFNSGRFFGFVAKEQNICAYITYSVSIDDADIESVYVEKPFRRKGIAKELLSLVEQKLKEVKKEKIFLEVREGNIGAIKLYENFGFKNISVRKKYYFDGENAVVMVKEIK